MPGTPSAIASVLAPAIAPLRNGLAGLAELVDLGSAAIAAMFTPPFLPWGSWLATLARLVPSRESPCCECSAWSACCRACSPR